MEEVLAQAQRSLTAALTTPLFGLSPAQLVSSVDTCCRLRSMVDSLFLSVLRQADVQNVAREQGATSTAVWLAGRQRIAHKTAAELVKLARLLDQNAALHPACPDPDPDPPAAAPDGDEDAPDGIGPGGRIRNTRDALAAGLINLAQARVITRAVVKVPVEWRAEAEARLLALSTTFTTTDLERLGATIFERLDPVAAEAAEAEALRRAEQRAYQDRALYLTNIGTSRVRISGTLDTAGAADVRAALEPLCSPKTTGGDDRRTYPQRRADALVDICRRVLADKQLPDNGGEPPQVVLTMRIEALRDQIGTAMLEDGGLISATEARRIACDAGIIPAVLGGKGQVLDLGRERRLYHGPIRRALMLRDGGCSFPGCDRPPRWCTGHHIRFWLNGGTTNLTNGAALCTHHHHLIHDGDWEVRINPKDGLPEFLPPTYIDNTRTPRRNPYHRRQ
jgi:hypothetical protein